MKRLSETFQKASWRPDSEWSAAIGRWTAMGVDTLAVRQILQRATAQRVMFEDYLRVRNQRLSLMKEFREQMRRLDQTIAHGQPLIRLLKRYDHIVPGVGMRVEQALNDIRVDMSGSDPDRLRTPQHRPGEQWLPSFAHRLAALFRERGQTLIAIRKETLEAFRLAGHGDWVTRDRIRRIVTARQATQATPNPRTTRKQRRRPARRS